MKISVLSCKGTALLLGAFSLVTVLNQNAFAQESKLPAADMYQSPGFMAPSGDMNISPQMSEGGLVRNAFPAEAAAVGDTTNYLGCAGVGQGEFTSALYQMPESFAKFQEDVNSNLSRNLLAMNFVLPQTAAMFDQLNTFGSQRYQAFQQGCSLDALKQDAKQQYVKACVAKIQPDRLKLIQAAMGSSGGNTNADKQNAMAYAQAWEVCSNQYISDTVALAERKQGVAKFAQKARELEDVVSAIRPLLCPVKAAAEGNDASETDKGCWPSLLIPQVRMCLGPDLENGCEGEYGVKEPRVSMRRFYDAVRYFMEDNIIKTEIAPLNQALFETPYDTTGAAREAVIQMSTVSMVEEEDGPRFSEIPVMPKSSVQDFQLHFLSCRDSDALRPVRFYVDKLQTLMGGSWREVGVVVHEIDTDQYTQFVKSRMGLTNGDELDGTANGEADANSFGAMLQVALGCTVNQSVPMFDPKLMSSMLKCSADERSAFYTLASNDVALVATRDTYRYVNLRLKQVYTQLLSNNLVPVSATATAGSVSPTFSAELNGRLARAVKETMIPYIDSQIERINELNNVRGAFGKRAQEIYKSGSGCMGGG
ncbi:MAG: hypothetical protein DI585_04420 [Pseudomonas fluorescens]|nr:MAG: hypothetical protein DI585_04420 [Pseudomonas fluorescens]